MLHKLRAHKNRRQHLRDSLFYAEQHLGRKVECAAEVVSSDKQGIRLYFYEIASAILFGSDPTQDMRSLKTTLPITVKLNCQQLNCRKGIRLHERFKRWM